MYTTSLYRQSTALVLTTKLEATKRKYTKKTNHKTDKLATS